VSSESAPPLLIAAITLLVAALFNPLRRSIVSKVDRRFNRSKYDSERVVERFSGTLQNQVDSDDLVKGWIGVVVETMEPSSVGAWVKGS
jgi:hypothetical protein